MKSKLNISPGIKIILGLMTAISLSVIGVEQWQKSQLEKIDGTPWTLASVESGDRFTVARNNETKIVSLCGVGAKGDIAKNYLQMVLNKRDGKVVIEQSGNAYDVWITIDPDNAVELLKGLPYEVETSPEVNIHLNTWMLERGYARRDEQDSEQCSQPEYLVRAEKIAKENKAGIWQGK